MNANEKYKAVLDRFGKEAQIAKLHEECLELLEALYSDDIDSILDEAADVKNVVESINIEFNGRIDKNAEKKLDRTILRMETGYYE